MKNFSSSLATDFHKVWQNPNPDALTRLLHPDTILYQPHLKPIRGIRSAHREFMLFLTWMPHFKGEVISSSLQDNLLFVEWFMHFRFKGGGQIRIRTVDKIVVENGLIKERSVYFNTLPIILYILKRPWLWFAYLKYRTASRH